MKSFGKVRHIFFFLFVLNIICLQPTDAQYINKGMWYHQQPTSQADAGVFFGGSATYEGWCGPSAVAMVVHYFVPNVHKIFYDKFGSIDYHSNDNRGGLTPKDPYCYSPSTTYPFGDFLAHHYLGTHITTSGVGYYGLRTIIEGLDQELDSYTAKYAFVPLGNIRSYLNDGYIIIMNTKEGHYISVTGWDGSLTDANQRFYYIWDGWRYPLGMESYTYRTDLVGNAANLGTAKNISVYTITEPLLNSHLRDQIGDGTVLAVKFIPDNLPQTVSNVNAKGIWAWSSIVGSEGVDNFISNISSHGITDLFLLVKDTSGTFDTQTLEAVIPKAHSKGIKVHAWVSVLNDKTCAASGNYQYVGKSWIDACDVNYRDNFINNIIKPLCVLDIDGIHLDCMRYPGNANSYSKAHEAITEYCRLAREMMNNNNRENAALSAAIMSEGSSTSANYGQDASQMTPYMKFITLTTYTHHYLTGPDWVGNQVAYFTNHVAAGCKVWAGIQALDEDGNSVTPYEMRQCINFASANGSAGIVYFRYPLKSWQWEFSDELKTTGVNKKYKNEIPDSYELCQNYPNPFNPTTVIDFKLAKSGIVSFKIFDMLGREIATLVNKDMNAGSYKIDFNAKGLSSGVYFYKLNAGNFCAVKKMILAK